jgi:glycosyltransferase involved in cell wall biosynthesis
MDTGKVNTTIIVPAFNEEDGLPVVLTDVMKVIDETCEVIVVDDGSADGTSEAASGFPCTVIRHEVNKGKGEALKTGITAAKGENVIWIDSDNSYPAEYIPRMIEAFEEYDVVMIAKTGRPS